MFWLPCFYWEIYNGKIRNNDIAGEKSYFHFYVLFLGFQNCPICMNFPLPWT